MATNKYFKNNFPGVMTPEQQLMEELIIEAIQMNGADIFYLPRKPLSQEDTIYGEYQGSLFDEVYPIEVYWENTSSFDGPSEFFSKFGLEIKDSMRLIMARRQFKSLVKGYTRPREGDLLYLPQLTNLFEIKFVEEEKDFYSLGRRPPMFYYYELQVELFKFNNERFRTGNPDIDGIATDYSYTQKMTMGTGTGNYSIGENVYQGSSYASGTATAKVKSWNGTTKLLEIITIKGKFADNVNIIGDSSGASYILSTFDRRDFSGVVEENVDNKGMVDESLNIIDFGTGNPFGTPGET